MFSLEFLFLNIHLLSHFYIVLFWHLNFELSLTFFLNFLDEWENFLERIGQGDIGYAEIQESSTNALELRFWASYRGQTLARTGLIALFVCSFYLVNIQVKQLGELRCFLVSHLTVFLSCFMQCAVWCTIEKHWCYRVTWKEDL